MALIAKTMFAIFVVIVVFLVLFIFVGNRINQLEEENQFSSYEQSNKFLLAVLGNPNCLSVGNILEDKQSTLQGVLDYNKLNDYTLENQELWCVVNFHFLYSIEVEDNNKNIWLIGIRNSDPEWAEKKIKTTYPCVIRFDNGILHPGRASLIQYSGNIPRFIGLLKEACITQQSRTYELSSRYEVSYNNSKNIVYIGEDYFSPYFPCKVEDFRIEKGKKIMYIKSENNTIRIIE